MPLVFSNLKRVILFRFDRGINDFISGTTPANFNLRVGNLDSGCACGGESHVNLFDNHNTYVSEGGNHLLYDNYITKVSEEVG